MKNLLLIFLTSSNLHIGYIYAEAFNMNEFFERNEIFNKCVEDENNILIYGKRREKYCNCYVEKYMSKSIPLLASLECHLDTLDKI